MGGVIVERRQLDFRDFDAVAAEVERLRSQGYTKAGTWDLREICDHLSTTMRMSLEGFTFKAPWLLRTLFGPIFRRRILKNRRMPVGIKAAQPLMPGPPGDEQASVKVFTELLARVRDPQAQFQPSPFFGVLSPDEWRQLHLIHAAHHLGFLIPNGPATPTS
jgi:uncharacterized protein DUF1569